MSKENMTKVPVHISMIMDGNGRWAKERGKERVYGHFEGVESVRACVEAALETGIRYLSVFAFSEENWNRPEDEVLALMGLMVKAMAAEMESLNKNGVRFMVLGNRARLSAELNAEIDSCMEMTAANDALTLIVFLSYSGSGISSRLRKRWRWTCSNTLKGRRKSKIWALKALPRILLRPEYRIRI